VDGQPVPIRRSINRPAPVVSTLLAPRPTRVVSAGSAPAPVAGQPKRAANARRPVSTAAAPRTQAATESPEPTAPSPINECDAGSPEAAGNLSPDCALSPDLNPPVLMADSTVSKPPAPSSLTPVCTAPPPSARTAPLSAKKSTAATPERPRIAPASQGSPSKANALATGVTIPAPTRPNTVRPTERASDPSHLTRPLSASFPHHHVVSKGSPESMPLLLLRSSPTLEVDTVVTHETLASQTMPAHAVGESEPRSRPTPALRTPTKQLPQQQQQQQVRSEPATPKGRSPARPARANPAPVGAGAPPAWVASSEQVSPLKSGAPQVQLRREGPGAAAGLERTSHLHIAPKSPARKPVPTPRAGKSAPPSPQKQPRPAERSSGQAPAHAQAPLPTPPPQPQPRPLQQPPQQQHDQGGEPPATATALSAPPSPGRVGAASIPRSARGAVQPAARAPPRTRFSHVGTARSME
jgi:hypothetical protein